MTEVEDGIVNSVARSKMGQHRFSAPLAPCNSLPASNAEYEVSIEQ